MHGIIMVLISIALLSYMALAGMSYLPGDLDTVYKTEIETNAGLVTHQNAYMAFRMARSGRTPDPATWETDLYPSFGSKPTSIQNFTWSYGQNAGGDYFCLSGQATQGQYKGILRVNEKLSDPLLVLGSACGDTADAPAPDAFPAEMFVTFWPSQPKP